MYVFIELDTNSYERFENHKEAWNRYENSDSPIKGVFRIAGVRKLVSINVTSDMFNGETDMLKQVYLDKEKKGWFKPSFWKKDIL